MNKETIISFRSVLRILEREIGFQTDAESQCCGVTLGQCHVLMELSERGELSLKDLTDSFGLDKSTLSRTVERMVEAGLLHRVEGKADRRFVSLSLSDQGKSLSDSVHRQCNLYYGKLFALIPSAKHAQIIESLSLLAGAMTELRKSSAEKSCCGR